jgi:hypothetical protein
MNGHARPYFEGHPTEVFDLAFDLICHPERGRFLADEGPAFAPVHGARLLELILNYPGVFVVEDRKPYRSLINSEISANDAASSPNVNVPFSAISRAPRKNAPNAARVNADPTLIRRTPAAARFATVSPLPFPPASTLTARGATAAQTARMASRFGNPGAKSTSAPASA